MDGSDRTRDIAPLQLNAAAGIFNKSVIQFVWALAETVRKYKVSGDGAEESALEKSAEAIQKFNA